MTTDIVAQTSESESGRKLAELLKQPQFDLESMHIRLRTGVLKILVRKQPGYQPPPEGVPIDIPPAIQELKVLDMQSLPEDTRYAVCRRLAFWQLPPERKEPVPQPSPPTRLQAHRYLPRDQRRWTPAQTADGYEASRCPVTIRRLAYDGTVLREDTTQRLVKRFPNGQITTAYYAVANKGPVVVELVETAHGQLILQVLTRQAVGR